MEWIVELVTNENEKIQKLDHHALVVDGVMWKLPEGIGLSFAEVSHPTPNTEVHMAKVYFGALSRYGFASTRIGSGLLMLGEVLELLDSDWHKTIGSYKFVDNGDGTYSSFEIDDGGIEYPMKVNKKFDRADLDFEIKGGFLVPEAAMASQTR